MIAKQKVYGFDDEALFYVMAYLNGRKHKKNIGSAFSNLLDIIFGFPQGSIRDPLLFIIFVCYIFILLRDID